MARQRPISKKSKVKGAMKTFKSTKSMDQHLDRSDLGELFVTSGVVKEPKIRKVNLDLPEWLLNELDKEAARAGVSRQPLIKIWLIQKLEEERRKRSA
jgi:predicted DNA binding CopG/RHH family protein